MLRAAMFCLCVGLAGGVFFANAWWLWFLLVVMVSSACCWLIFVRRRWQFPVAAGSLLMGALYAQISLNNAMAERIPMTVSGDPIRVTGVVDSLVSHREIRYFGERVVNVYKFELHADALQSAVLQDGAAWQGERQLMVRAYSDQALALGAGDVLDIELIVKPVHGLVNGVGPDSERVALARGIDGVARVVQWHAVDRADCCGLGQQRQSLLRHLQSLLEPHSIGAALIPALVAGDRRQLSAAHWQTLQRTGVAHLVSISGLHISLVCAAVWWLFRRLLGLPLALFRSRLVASQCAVLPALAAASLYASLAGFSLPTQRALLMTAMVMGAHLFHVRSSPLSVILFAAVVVLIGDPLAILSAGFWMSFVAVVLLAMLLAGSFRNLLHAQIFLSLISGVLAGWLFAGWSVVSVIANLVLVPLFSILVIPLALLGALSETTHFLLHACAQILEWIWPPLIWLARWPMLTAPTSLPVMLALVLCFLRWGLPFIPGPRWVMLLLLLPWLWPTKNAAPEVGEFELVAFDVGQGQMTAIRTHNKVILYDTGPAWERGSPVSAFLAPWLVQQGMQLDMAFISHGDEDHDGGYADLRSRWPSLAVFSGAPDKVLGTLPCLAGQHWSFDGIKVEVLWPLATLPVTRSNNHSCVVRVQSASGHSALLTGDIEQPVEFWLAQKEARVDSDLLQVPHHGSQTSSSYAFLRAVNPELSSVAAGFRNRFGHPAAETVTRMQERGVSMLNTADTGIQQFYFTAQGVEVGTLGRLQYAWPWRSPMPVIE